jgi:hypothetical protein
MSMGTMPNSNELSASFRLDLRGEWIPDYIGARDILAVLSGGNALPENPPRADSIRVPLATRQADVWNIDPVFRARLHVATEVAARRAESNLSPSVYGHKGLGFDHNAEYRRRLDDSEALALDASVNYVAIFDIRQFSKSVTLDMLAHAPWMTTDLHGLLLQLEELTGLVLMHGNVWSSRIGNLALTRVDAEVPKPFIRWGDDYHVFARSEADANEALGHLSNASISSGFEPNSVKNKVLPVKDYLATTARDVSVGVTVDVDSYRRAVEADDVRLLRYLLPRLDPADIATTLADLDLLASRHPSLLPRIAICLDRCADRTAAVETVDRLMQQPTEWTLARLLPVLVRHQSLRSAAGIEAASGALGSTTEAIAALASRVVNGDKLSAGRLPIDHVVGLDQSQPLVDTWL